MTRPSEQTEVRDRFELFVADIQHELFSYARCHTDNEQTCDDLCQEALLALYRRILQTPEPQSWKGYLFVIMRNLITSHYKQRSRDNEINRHLAPLTETYETTTTDEEKREDITNLLQHLDSMPEKLREPVTLKLFHGMTFNEIGTMLNLPASTVRSQYNQAIQQLGTYYETR